MPSRPRRAARHTVLLVGEGATDAAFLHHVKFLYLSRGCGVSATIRNARGKGPDHVVKYAVRCRRNAAYDQVAVLLDADQEMSSGVRRLARSKKVQIIGSIPCIEGLLLKILGQQVPATSKRCKMQVGAKLPDRLTAKESYRPDFSKELLDKRRNDVPELGKLLDCLLFD